MAEATQVVLTDTITALATVSVPVTRACRLVGLARSTYYRRANGYRHYRPVGCPLPQKQRRQPAALSDAERAQIIEVLSRDEYQNKSVVQAYWAAFDAGDLACSQRTFYRVAKAHRLVGDRRRTKRHPAESRRRPAVAATGVGQLWSWDVTELCGPGRERYYLYLVIDIFSRYPVGWRIEPDEHRQKAIDLFTTAITTHGSPNTVHSDNGSIQRAHDLVEALVTRGVTTSYSRPRVSDDNPFSESLFKTIKYVPHCPDRFESIEHARAWTAQFLHQYSTEHRHSGLGRHTPASVHYGTASEIHAQRQRSLDKYWRRNPERFRRRPNAPQLPQLAGINTHQLSQTA